MKIITVFATGLFALLLSGIFAFIGLVTIAAGGAGSAAVSITVSNPSQEVIDDIPPLLLQLFIEQAGQCAGPSWTIMAATSKIESNHGRQGGAQLDVDGTPDRRRRSRDLRLQQFRQLRRPRPAMGQHLHRAAHHRCNTNRRLRPCRSRSALKRSEPRSTPSRLPGIRHSCRSRHAGVRDGCRSRRHSPHRGTYPADPNRCGTTITIDGIDGGSYTHYHLSRLAATHGQIIDAGTLIGLSGGQRDTPRAGRTTGPHLHLGIRVGGAPVCPQPLLVAIYRNTSINPAIAPAAGCVTGQTTTKWAAWLDQLVPAAPEGGTDGNQPPTN